MVIHDNVESSVPDTWFWEGLQKNSTLHVDGF